jgi:hypothetical protein
MSNTARKKQARKKKLAKQNKPHNHLSKEGATFGIQANACRGRNGGVLSKSRYRSNKNTLKKDTSSHWYHVETMSTKDIVGDISLDKYIVKTPKHVVNAGPTEPELERICVADSVAKSLLSIAHRTQYENTIFPIYRTRKKVCASPAKDVVDAWVTEEHWILKDTEFELVGLVTGDDAEEIIASLTHHCGTKISGGKSMSLMNHLCKINDNYSLECMEERLEKRRQGWEEGDIL